MNLCRVWRRRLLDTTEMGPLLRGIFSILQLLFRFASFIRTLDPLCGARLDLCLPGLPVINYFWNRTAIFFYFLLVKTAILDSLYTSFFRTLSNNMMDDWHHHRNLAKQMHSVRISCQYTVQSTPLASKHMTCACESKWGLCVIIMASAHYCFLFMVPGMLFCYFLLMPSHVSAR